MNGTKWSVEEDELLKKIYPNTKKQDLLLFFNNRSLISIKHRAFLLNLKKVISYKANHIDKLLNESHESYYWIGFLLADGCIVNTILTLTLAYKDINHITKYAQFINGNIHIREYKNQQRCTVSVRDMNNIPKIMKKFDWKYNKTYNPPDLNNYTINKELLMSLFIGFIDGDGCVKQNNIALHLHSSWITYLSDIQDILNINSSRPYITKRNYLKWHICNKNTIASIIAHIKKYNLPVMERKWNYLR